MNAEVKFAIPWRPTIALAVIFGAYHAGWAQEIPGYPAVDAFDPREVAMLPRYCIHTQRFRSAVEGGNNPEQIQRWKSYMGDVFDHLHHYCLGMMKTNRALLLTRTREVRVAYLNDAVSEFDYVVARSPADFVLLPEILTRRGENLIRLGRAPSGMLDLERAAQLKPDYWPPYAQMSDYYKQLGDIDKAREQAEKGLSFAPDATALTRRLAELRKDGDKSKPRP